MNFHHFNHSMKMLLASTALMGTVFSYSATGFSVTSSQEASIKVGMTAEQVRAVLGRPAHSLKFRNEPGRTWIYDVIEMDIKNTHTVFYVDFGGDKKVLSTSERLETNESDF